MTTVWIVHPEFGFVNLMARNGPSVMLDIVPRDGLPLLVSRRNVGESGPGLETGDGGSLEVVNGGDGLTGSAVADGNGEAMGVNGAVDGLLDVPRLVVNYDFHVRMIDPDPPGSVSDSGGLPYA